MFRGSRFTAAALVLTGLFCVPAWPASGPPPWLEVHGPHFSVITDAGEKNGREAALRLEQMRSLFGALLTKNRLNMSQPVTVLLVKDSAEYAQMAPPGAAPAGFVLPGDDRCFIVLNGTGSEAWTAISAGFARYFLYYNYPPTQPWFDAGFIEYYSSLRIGERDLLIGGDPLSAGSDDQGVLKGPLADVLQTQKWLPLTEIFSMPRAEADKQGRSSVFAAESWMVLHYLINQQQLPQTGSYFDLVLNQKLPVDQAITKAFEPSPVQLEAAIKTYFRSLTAPAAPAGGSALAARFPLRIPPPVKMQDIGMNLSEVPDAEARALLADVMARVPEHRPAGIAALQALTRAELDNEGARRALAWQYIDARQFDKASQELSSAVELDSKDRWVRYYLALLKYRMSQAAAQPIEGLSNLMQDLRAVLDWYAEFAEAYNMLAIGRLEGGGANSALEAMRAAILLSPRNQQYVFNLALIYAGAKKFDAARAIFERLQSAPDAQISAAAKYQLDNMETLKKYGIPSARTAAGAMSASGAATSPPAKPPDIAAASASRTSGKDPSQAAEPDDESDAAPEPPKPVTPPPAAGRVQFLKGKLLSVDCSNPPAAVLTVTAGTKTISLRTQDYKALLVIGADAFSCGWQNRSVAVNYRSSGKTTGDVISVEVQ